MGLWHDSKSNGSDGKESGKDGGIDTYRPLDKQQGLLLLDDIDPFVF